MTTKEELIQFEEEIEELFLQKKIKAPIHLSKGNEEQLIEIFRKLRPQDWVLSTHRSHYHALLKGVPPELVKAAILAGRSMHLNFSEYNFFTSAIVGGTPGIALGLAMAIKMDREEARVWCFLGDMAAHTGAFYEATKYARNHNMPVCFVIEDNGLSTNTPTAEVWGIKEDTNDQSIIELEKWETGKILKYYYQRQCEHVGGGQWVTF